MEFRPPVPCLALILLLVTAMGCSINPTGQTTASDEVIKERNVRHFTIEAHQWEFIPDEIVVSEGDIVRLTVVSRKGKHGLALPSFGIQTGPIEQGRERTVQFIANRTGTFHFFSNIPSGDGYQDMWGSIIIE